jgi:class 3 adenylate cyclase
VGERLDALLRPQSSVGYVRRAEGFAPLFVHGREIAPELEANGPLVAALRRARGPIATDASGARGRGRLSGFERAALDELAASCVVPIDIDGELAGFLCFGPKRSGDIYTATDLGWLGAIADKVASQLRRFEDAAQIREERRLQAALRDYVPGSVAARLQSGERLESEEREVTVLFVDIRSYSSFAEGRRASEIFSTVNRYTEAVSRIIGESRGTVVEFSGDGMMAVFGAPEPLERKERAAVVAAQEIALAVRALEVDAPLAVGIGIATGSAFVGSIRSADRLIWSALGNTTNLASRLQGLTRDLDAAIVIDAVTHARAGPIASDFEAHPRVQIRGLAEPHDLFAKRLAR